MSATNGNQESMDELKSIGDQRPESSSSGQFDHQMEGKEVSAERYSSDNPREEPTATVNDGSNEKDVQSEAKENPQDDDEDVEKDDDYEYPKAWRLAVITLALCLCVFCLALDNTIISTAIPKITDEFHALDDVGWYASSYLLTTCAFQLLYGKYYSFFSIKWTYLFALGVFEVGSIICAAAPNSIAFIIGRAVAGLGAAGIFSGSILIVSYTVPLRQRSAYVGLIGGMFGLASVSGPLLGGVFTDSAKLTWRFCFWINLPLGGITALFITLFFQSPHRPHVAKTSAREKLKHFDLFGTAILLPSVVCLLLALQWGGSKYAWSNGRVIALLVVFVLSFAFFGFIQFRRGDYATVPIRVLKQRTVAASSFYVAMLGGSFFVMIFYIPIWFQAIKGTSAEGSGIRNLGLVLSVVVASLISGGAVTGLGYYNPFLIASSILQSIGAGLITTWEVNSGRPVWLGYQILYGFGIGFGMQLPLIAVQNVLPKKDVPVGTAIIIFSQSLAGALLVSVGQNVFGNKLILNIRAVAPNIDPGLVISTGATTLRDYIPPQDLGPVLVAYNKALDETFYVAVALSSLSILGAVFVEWKSVKGKKMDMAASSA